MAAQHRRVVRGDAASARRLERRALTDRDGAMQEIDLALLAQDLVSSSRPVEAITIRMSTRATYWGDEMAIAELEVPVGAGGAKGWRMTLNSTSRDQGKMGKQQTDTIRLRRSILEQCATRVGMRQPELC